MTDRELLELAAKAAGHLIREWAEADFYSHRSGEVAYITGDGEWNPLTDDGDALRLAVKFNFIIDPVAKPEDGSAPSAAVWHEQGKRYITEPFGSDPYAATRRAIVRAAAEIGKATP